MRNMLVSCISLIALGYSAPALAQTTIDVAKITCDQLVLLKVADPDYLAVWLSGYYSGQRNNTIIEVEKLKENANKVRRYCIYDGKSTVMEAIDKLMAAGK